MINKALATITPAEKSAIQGKYLSLRYEYGIKPRDIVKWILIVVGISVLIVSMFVVWNRQLTRKVKRRTSEVVESHEKFRKFVEQSPISIQISNPDGSLNEVNPSFLNLWGFSEADLPELFEKYNVLQDEQARKLGIMPLLERAYKGEEVILPPIKYDANETLDALNLSSHNALNRWIQVRIYPIKDQNGELVNVVHIEEDITERKQTEEQMAELRSELLHSTRTGTMVELTAALAPELNHPLGSILNNANAAKRFLDSEDPDLDEIREIISDIISEDRRASDVMQKLRALMKKAEVQFALLQINDIVEEVLTLTHSELVIQNISLVKQLATKLPKINGDRIQLQQIFLNLIINAVAAMKESEIKNLHISTAQQDAENLVICVKDSGTGIEESKKDTIFKPFYTTKKEGLGMGLSVNMTIAKTHGGNLWAENNPEGGASFYITLPIYTKESS